MTGERLNIVDRLDDCAAISAERIALDVPVGSEANGAIRYRSYSFDTIRATSESYAAALKREGIEKGAITLLMVPPGLAFVTLSFALFRLGAVPVLIDPGMGKKNLFECIERLEASALVGIGKAHLAARLFPQRFRALRRRIYIGNGFFPGAVTLRRCVRQGERCETEPTAPTDMAAILFTTGSTGPPKGVIYTHAIFDAQVAMIQKHYGITPADVDLPAFPLFALFTLAMGARAVIPQMDPTRPAKADPAKLTRAINQMGVTYTFGSPAIWRNVSRWCVEKKVTLPTLRKALMAGAPVSDEIHERLLTSIMTHPEAATHTPYGATESLPVADISGAEVLRETAALTHAGMGVCVGKPLEGMRVAIIPISNEPIDTLSDDLMAPTGVIGEIVVTGAIVSPGYYGLPEMTALSHIGGVGSQTRRMGDVGYLDHKGRLWFCGRKGHRVVTGAGTLFTIPCEAIFNNHPEVYRSALVGVGASPDEEPIIIVERHGAASSIPNDELADELLRIGAGHALTTPITGLLFHPEFPTDIRHNAKIFRERLKIWAGENYARIYRHTGKNR